MRKYDEIWRGILVPRSREMCNSFGEYSLHNSFKSCHFWPVATVLDVEIPGNMHIDQTTW